MIWEIKISLDNTTTAEGTLETDDIVTEHQLMNALIQDAKNGNCLVMRKPFGGNIYVPLGATTIIEIKPMKPEELVYYSLEEIKEK